MIAAFIFIIILLSLLFCCSCSQNYYQEGFDGSTCKSGCTKPINSYGNCKYPVINGVRDTSQLICPWNCINPTGDNTKCKYDYDCEYCSPKSTFSNIDSKCPNSEYGCCADGLTLKVDGFGSNCSSTPSAHNFSGSSGSSGPNEPSLHYDNRYKERRRLLNSGRNSNQDYNTTMALSGSTGSTGSTGSFEDYDSAHYHNNDDDDYSYYKSNCHNDHDNNDDYNHYTSKYHNNDNEYDSDNYILKTMIVPPICPACPNIIYPDANAFKSIEECGDDDKSKKQPTPAPSLAPTQSNSSSSYSNMDAWATTPYPILKDFTTYGM